MSDFWTGMIIGTIIIGVLIWLLFPIAVTNHCDRLFYEGLQCMKFNAIHGYEHYCCGGCG